MIETSHLTVLILTGLITGLVYGLMGLGLSVTFGVLRIINVAHGALIMVGMYITYWLHVFYGISPFLLAFLNAVIFFGIGVLLQLALIETPVRLKMSFTEIEALGIIVTVGLAAFLEGMANSYWSPDVRQLLIPSLNLPVGIGSFVVSNGRLYTALITIAVYLVSYFFFKRTYTGLSIKAVFEDREATGLVGASATLASLIAGGVGGALTGVSASLLTLIEAFYPAVGWQFVLFAFVVVVLGGMGNLAGSLIAGMIIGILEIITIVYYNTLAVPLVFLGIFIVVLAVKPEGIFR